MVVAYQHYLPMGVGPHGGIVDIGQFAISILEGDALAAPSLGLLACHRAVVD